MRKLAFASVLILLGAGGKYDPVVTSTTVTRSMEFAGSNYWQYTLKVTGRHFDTGAVILLETGEHFSTRPIPPFMQALVESGGLMKHIRKTLVK